MKNKTLMKKIMGLALLSFVATGAFSYQIHVTNESDIALPYTVNAGTSGSIAAHSNGDITVPSWGNNVAIRYMGSWSPQGFLNFQRSQTFNVISSYPARSCAGGLADLKATLMSGLDAGHYVQTTTGGNCSLDGGITCKVGNNGEENDVTLTITGKACPQ